MHPIKEEGGRNWGEQVQGSDHQIEPTARTLMAVYRVELPMMVLAFKDNHRAAVTMQAGEVFKVVGPAQDDRFVIVDVKGERFLVFECDLKYRGKPIPDRKAKRASRAG